MQCFNPIGIKNPRLKKLGIADPQGRFDRILYVPCGKCAACMHNLRNDWIIRLKKEMDAASTCYFLTLTYDDEHLPINDAGFPTLVKSDFVDWFKRFRERSNRDWSGAARLKMKYFAVGEYGGDLGRPHYHLLLFNYPFGIDNLHDIGHELWSKCVDYEFDCRIGSGALIGYITKYMLKQYDDDSLDSSQLRPFRLLSKGLGKSIVDDSYLVDYLRDARSRTISDGRFKYRVPRYFKDKIAREVLKDTPFNGMSDERNLKRIVSRSFPVDKAALDNKMDDFMQKHPNDGVLRIKARREQYTNYIKKLSDK